MYVQCLIVFKVCSFCSFTKCFLEALKDFSSRLLSPSCNITRGWIWLIRKTCLFFLPNIFPLLWVLLCPSFIPLLLVLYSVFQGAGPYPSIPSHIRRSGAPWTVSHESQQHANPVCVILLLLTFTSKRTVELRLCGCSVSVKTAFKFKIALLKFGERHAVRTLYLRYIIKFNTTV